MIRFFTNPGNISKNQIKLSDEDTKHIRSLRLRPGEEFIVCDGAETDYVCKLSADDIEGMAEILRQEKTHAEPKIHATIYIAYAKGDRLNYAVQKAVELGAKAIVLFRSKRCIAVPDNTSNKTERLCKIAYEAAKQSGRGVIPTVKDGGNFKAIIDTAIRENALAIMLFEDENTTHLKEVLEQPGNKQTVAIISGPEGGFEASEAKAAKEIGIQTVSLGPRILRSETAPIATLSALMYHTNNL